MPYRGEQIELDDCVDIRKLYNSFAQDNDGWNDFEDYIEDDETLDYMEYVEVKEEYLYDDWDVSNW